MIRRVIIILKRLLLITIILSLFAINTGCGTNDDSNQDAKNTSQEKLLTDAEIKDIIYHSEKTAVDILNLAIKERMEGIEKPPFESVKLKLIEHYSTEIVTKLGVFYESNCEGWSNLAAIFPFYEREKLDEKDITFEVIERGKDKIIVFLRDPSDVMQMELGQPYESTYILENINGTWIITEQK
ncbi:hypothetical protein SAMN05660649_03517 [Desulfotomaculum arcticum]|uniref:Uncharacterized protein n=1 Tax=Desulfotruncus arcticus DSM 17038 TaxID=1121424 RepID=A0A1I2WHP8_9FIRM|nr:hypothetical protein SAMN05660649_03517 [Desulfotomaculum arcticum] [Desulfotruncus arcticus DSM 17038]